MKETIRITEAENGYLFKSNFNDEDFVCLVAKVDESKEVLGGMILESVKAVMDIRTVSEVEMTITYEGKSL